jgi:beta-glucosidase
LDKKKIKELVAELTLEEKASLCSGNDFWRTKAVERLNIPSVMVSDGPHGLRKQDDAADNLGINDSIKAVAFPAGCASAASFNRELIESVGETLGEECQAEGVATLLGPGVCIKRSPLCGRNFEYFSEDPYVASETATAFINGVQSKKVGTSIKHFLANSQEHRRMSSSSEIDERTLREIYLASFEGAVKNAKPYTIMCSYNRINGLYSAGNKKFLTDILRDEWGYEGVVVSDWGAVDRRVEDLKAGLDLEMPASHGENDKLIVEAVKNGSLPEEILDRSVERILNWVFKCDENKENRREWNRLEDHKKAIEAAKETIVLLKNDSVLPLKEGEEVAFIGKYAKTPRYQGGGSSHINSMYVTGALDYAAESVIKGITYSKGFDDKTDEIDEKMIAEAVEAAKKAKKAVIFAGLPDSYESEGFDRRHMRMPEAQNRLISAVAAVQPDTIVVLHNGSPIEMPWINEVKAVVECYLSGEGVGAATVEILYGRVNPSAKLAETFPRKLSDNPSYLYYFGEGDKVEYKEGVFVGYRYYDKKEMDVLFPFGHGLSYTSFEYSNLTLSADEIKDTDTLTVNVDIKNVGNLAGKEVVQLYVGAKDGEFVLRPVKELRGYEKVELQPGETKTVTFKLSKRAFAYYDTEISDWYVETGSYEILIGKSSRDIQCKKSVKVTGTTKKPVKFTADTTCGDILRYPQCSEKVIEFFNRYMNIFSQDNEDAKEAISEEMVRAQLEYMPLHAVMNFSLSEPVSYQKVLDFVAELNDLVNK